MGKNGDIIAAMLESSFLNPPVVIAAARLTEGMRVADLGAGAGFFARAAARAVGPTGEVWAVDACPGLWPRLKSLALAEGLRNVEVVGGISDALRGTHLPDASFDLVILANILFAVENKSALAAEAARILKTSSFGARGRVLLVDWRESVGGLGPHPKHVVGEGTAR